MVRFDPGERRIATARSFEVCEGGGEYNVARGLKRCFGLDTAVVTAFANDPVGRLLEDLIYQRSESTRLNSSHGYISYAVFCLKKNSQAARAPALGARTP